MNFKQYLVTQIGRKDLIGDLAKRVKSLKATTYEEIYGYLYSMHASDEEIHALKVAFKEYSGEDPDE